MSSVTIISGVAARVKHLMNQGPELTDYQLLLSEMESTIETLRSADNKTKRSKPFMKLEKLIVQHFYDIADAVDNLILLPPKPKPTLSSLFRLTHGPSSSNGQSELEKLATYLKILKNFAGYMSTEPIATSPRKAIHRAPPPPREEASLGDSHTHIGECGSQNNVVKGNVETIGPPPSAEQEVRECLKRAESVVCMYGGRGTGKTTLAEKVLEEARRGDFGCFRGFAWVQVKGECEPRRVFEEILRQLSTERNKAYIKGMDEIEMIQQILMIQRDTRCLLVLDDVLALHDWNSIRVALLVGRSTKTLITTSSWDLANVVGLKAQLYMMPRLQEPQISTILKNKASFHDHEVDAYKEIISELSGGSPLFAVVLGKCFKRADKTTRDQMVEEYYYAENRNRGGGENEALEACYRLLPDELKPCLNYMGSFPEGHEIQVDKLHLLWEAEGFLEHSTKTANDRLIFQKPVRDVLEKLASRNLVEVDADKATVARMLLVRNFCICKGLDEEFFKFIEFGRGERERTTKKMAMASSPTSFARLAIDLTNYKDGDAIPFTAERVRSLLIFDASPLPRKFTWPSEISDLKEMSGLRIADFNGIDFRVSGNRILRGIDKLVFLRYLSMQGCWLETFPSCITKLKFLETLDLRVHNDCVMFLPNILTEMTTLRNLYFPLLYKTQRHTKLQVFALRMLEILVNFHTGVCSVNDLYWLKNLKLLTVICSEGNHKDFADIVKYSCRPEATLQQSSFVIRKFNYSPERAVVLKRLFQCPSIHSLHIQGNIKELPEEIGISPNLSEIVLDGPELEGDPTSVLRRLKNLHSLVLANDAFVGEKISILFAAKCFRNLRSLKLRSVRNLEKLSFNKGSVPKLWSLVVEKCEKMKQVSMPMTLDSRLQAAQRKKGDDVVYMLHLTPTLI